MMLDIFRYYIRSHPISDRPGKKRLELNPEAESAPLGHYVLADI
jgi:hypothetical protein